MHKTLLLALSAALLAVGADAQTVRFHTNVGAFDMLLNPTGDANLQPHVDNMLANIAAGVYHRNWINRAPSGFVLQMGGFTTQASNQDELIATGFEAVDSFDPVVVDADNDGTVDFDISGLTNTRGTVSLALSAGNANSGNSSFFINASDSNTFLDAQNFVPFAVIDDMATVDRILNLQSVDLTAALMGSGPTFTDIPLTDDGDLVFLESVVVISDESYSFKGPLLNAFDIAFEDASASATSAATSANALALATVGPMPLGAETPQPIAAASSVPEPSTLMLLVGVGASLAARCRLSR